MRIGCYFAAFAMLIAPAVLPSASAQVDDVTGEQVKQAIARGVRAIKSLQEDNGSWGQGDRGDGLTCLATLALLQSGEKTNATTVARAIDYIRTIRNERTYTVSLKLMVLSVADPAKYRPEIHAAAKWLIGAQLESGMWTYDASKGAFDNSNSQFALLGLHHAAQAGIEIPAIVWNKARARVIDTQRPDGGWAYQSLGDSYGSMTAAGVANLLILGANMSVSKESGFREGAAPDCGKYGFSRPLNQGMNWLSNHFTAEANPGRANWYVNYWLYAIERVGMLSGRRAFGQHDWYRRGAARLVREQNNRGQWGNGLVDTSFAVLFLGKGHKPLAIQKLAWSNNEDQWNLDRRDVENLVAFIGDKLGEPVSWQVVDIDAPLDQWLAAPLLYMQGHQFPQWSPVRKKKLREYVEKGGTVLVEACCGREPFQRGFEQFCSETFPDYPLRELDENHPVYRAHFEVPPYGLKGIDLGCRTSVIYAPRDLSCLWEQAQIPLLSEQAFKLGTNIAAFATGRQALRDRLDIVTVPDSGQRTDDEPTLSGVRLAQIVYDGDWSPDPTALVHFAEYLRDQFQLSIVTAYKPVRLDERELAGAPIAYMTGHYELKIGDAERAALRAYLRRGGFVFVDACCGRPAFDQSFRAMIAEAFPGEPFELIPPEHPLFTGNPGYKIDRVAYKPTAHVESPDLDRPQLWGLTLSGRLALVYSPYSLGCGLDGHKCFNCRGVVDDDARRIAANIVMFALTR